MNISFKRINVRKPAPVLRIFGWHPA